MSLSIIKVPFDTPSREAIKRSLKNGDVMTYPTETAFALGGNGLDAKLAETIHSLKGRCSEKSLLLLIEGEEMMEALTQEVSPAARVLIRRFWPGPLTLVFQGSEKLPPLVRDSRGTVALRWSPHPVVKEIIGIGETPLIGTSANKSGEPPAQTVEEVLDIFGDSVTRAIGGLVNQLDAPGELGETGEPDWNEGPSTIVDTTVLPFKILREGAVPKSRIQAVLAESYIDAMPD